MDSPSFPGVRTVYRKEILEGCLKEDNTKEVRMASTGKIHQLFVIAHNLEVYYGMYWIKRHTGRFHSNISNFFEIFLKFPENSKLKMLLMDPSWESNSLLLQRSAEALRRTWSVEEMGVIRQVMLSPAGIIFVCWVYL